ncbi:MAG: diguanylate cyclase [Mycobacterium kyogaense]|uniref:sensor domain-containing diguanylate cyclase n=1 Tax=Mycobacterium kyogaense TaxID=2212479 RepID=UPI002FF5E237
MEIQRRMLDASPDCMKLIAPDATLLAMNAAGRQALGLSQDAELGMDWPGLLTPDCRQAARDALRVARSGETCRFSGSSRTPYQSTRMWDNLLIPIHDAHGGVTAIVCVSRDVTAEREARAELHESRQRLMLATQVGGLGVWDYDIDDDVLHCDSEWYRIVGRDEGPRVTRVAEMRSVIHPDDVDEATEVVETAAELAATGAAYERTFRIVRPEDEVRWVRSVARLITDEVTGHRRVIGFITDITEAHRQDAELRAANEALERLTAELTHQSMHDPLTGAANRRQLSSRLAEMATGRDSQGHDLAIGMVDIDHFKAYNDHYGHLAGDTALQAVAASIMSAVEPDGTVARFGGEEFVFVVHGGAERLDEILTRLTTALDKAAIPHAASTLGRITLSCGCVLVPAECAFDAESLLAQCDDALYAAKRQGRDRVVVRRFDVSQELAH